MQICFGKAIIFSRALFRENIVGFDSLENGGSIDFLFVHKD